MINVFGSCVGEEELKEIRSSLDAQWLGMGPKVDRFEKLFSEKLGQKFILLDNCSNGLYLAVQLLGLPEGSEVVLPANTWVSCATAVVLNGFVPVFADCDYETLNVTRETVADVLTSKTKAIMVVHYAGYPCDVESLKCFGLPIIEDTAHAADSTIGGKHCGTLGDIGVFSFDSMKNIACGELGGITCKDPELMEKANKSRYCGLSKSGLQASTEKPRWWEYELNGYCIKQLPNDIAASIGLAQLRKLPGLQETRKRIYERYRQEFGGPGGSPGMQHSYFTYFLRDTRRDELARYLLESGIYATVRYQPLHLLFKDYYRKPLPISEDFGECGLNLPLHPNLTDEDVDYIIKKVNEFAFIKRDMGICV
jgi:dTDP-4-amino-4,6-dideoxygalactose transaminase